MPAVNPFRARPFRPPSGHLLRPGRANRGFRPRQNEARADMYKGLSRLLGLQ